MLVTPSLTFSASGSAAHCCHGSGAPGPTPIPLSLVSYMSQNVDRPIHIVASVEIHSLMAF